MKKTGLLALGLALSIGVVAEAGSIPTNRVPLQTYAIKKVNCYLQPNGTQKGWIDPGDYVVVTQIRSDGWAYGSYPVGKGRTSRWFRADDLVNNIGFTNQERYSPKSFTYTYTNPNHNKQFGSFNNNEPILVVSDSGQSRQFIYKVSGGGYKMAWVPYWDCWDARQAGKENINNNPINTTPINIVNGLYSIQPQCAPNSELTVLGASKTHGTDIIIYSKNSQNHTQKSHQKWYVTRLSNGYYKIIAENSGLALNNHNGANTNGNPITQWEYSGFCQEFRFFNAGNGYYYIQPKGVSGVLDVSGGGSANNTKVQLYQYNGTAAQKWKLERRSPGKDEPGSSYKEWSSLPKRDCDVFEYENLTSKKGRVDTADPVTVFGESGNAYHIRYKLTKGGTKEGWVTKDIFKEISYGSIDFNSIRNTYPDYSKFKGGIHNNKCHDYALKVISILTGKNVATYNFNKYKRKNKSELRNLGAGDLVRYKNDGHTLIVTSVNGNTINFTDCNSDWKNTVRWRSLNVSEIEKSFYNGKDFIIKFSDWQYY